jgi:hypothetical protein
VTNLVEQAINCDDCDRAARIIMDALGICDLCKSNCRVNVIWKPGRGAGCPARRLGTGAPRLFSFQWSFVTSAVYDRDMCV